MDYAYLVSGVYRSGTSMMVRMLEAAGLPVVFDHHQDMEESWRPHSDYHPNPNGFYEPSGLRFDDNFYENHAGKVTKCELTNLRRLPKGKYRVVFMKRNPKEIWKSSLAFDRFSSVGGHDAITFLYDVFIPAFLTDLRENSDVECIEFDYNGAMESVDKELSKLDSWGLDTNAMKTIAEPQLYRNRHGN